MKIHTTISQIILLFLLSVLLLSCKKSTTTPTTTTDPLNGTWSVSAWGGVNGNILKFVANTDLKTGVITQIGSQSFNFAVGDQLYTNIAATSAGTYTCMGKYTYGTNNANSGTRSAILTLQNSNTQLTADYPAISTSFPEIIYVYQK